MQDNNNNFESQDNNADFCTNQNQALNNQAPCNLEQAHAPQTPPYEQAHAPQIPPYGASPYGQFSASYLPPLPRPVQKPHCKRQHILLPNPYCMYCEPNLAEPPCNRLPHWSKRAFMVRRNPRRFIGFLIASSIVFMFAFFFSIAAMSLGIGGANYISVDDTTTVQVTMYDMPNSWGNFTTEGSDFYWFSTRSYLFKSTQARNEFFRLRSGDEFYITVLTSDIERIGQSTDRLHIVVLGMRIGDTIVYTLDCVNESEYHWWRGNLTAFSVVFSVLLVISLALITPFIVIHSMRKVRAKKKAQQ